jgi:hypothetical protein
MGIADAAVPIEDVAAPARGIRVHEAAITAQGRAMTEALDGARERVLMMAWAGQRPRRPRLEMTSRPRIRSSPAGV